MSNSQLNKDEYFCDYCGKKIVKSYFNSNVQHHFCNKTCQALWRNANVNILECNCVICGKKFVTRKRGDNTASTCSRHCRGLLRWKRYHEAQSRITEKSNENGIKADKKNDGK